MTLINSSLQGRQHLDKRFFIDSKDSVAIRLARPQRGWIKAIREALGMSSAQLAARVGVSQPAISEVERSEASGSVKLETLERIAAALNCRLVYALIPNEPLVEMVRKQAVEVARRHFNAVEHTMRLEGQVVSDATVNSQQMESLVSELDVRRLWD